MPNPFSKKKRYRITGRIRDQDNHSVEACAVLAFDKDLGVYLNPDDRLGTARTDINGSFLIKFDQDAFVDWFESNPQIYLTIRDKNGKILLKTSDKENLTGDADFQIKLGKSIVSFSEPDLYSGGVARIAAALKNIGDSADLSKSDTKILFELILRVVTSWTIEKDSLAQIQGYDAIQVPENPRMEEHNHVTRWDKPILPI